VRPLPFFRQCLQHIAVCASLAVCAVVPLTACARQLYTYPVSLRRPVPHSRSDQTSARCMECRLARETQCQLGLNTFFPELRLHRATVAMSMAVSDAT